MMKFFRKYNKHMLAVFMALLLIVWLADDAIRRLLQPDEIGGKVASAFGRELSPRDLEPITRGALILQTLGVGWQTGGWQYIWYGTLMDLGANPFSAPVRQTPLDEYEWYMLVEEARRQNIPVTPREIEEIKASLMNGEARIDAARDRMKASLADIDAAIADYLRVHELARRAAGGLVVTEPEIYQQAKQVGEKVRVQFVVLPASAFQVASAPVDEKGLAELFEKYKDTAPGTDPDVPFGYQQPAAVQVEYVQVDINKVAEKIPVESDAAWRYWKEHPAEFQRQPPAPTQPSATQPAAQPVTIPFSEVKDSLLARIRKDRAKDEAMKLGQSLLDDLRAPWKNVPADEFGYAKAPQAVQAEKYMTTLLDTFTKRRFGDAIRYARTNWLTRSDIWQEKGIGMASAPGGRSSVRFGQAALQVAGLVSQKPPASQPAAEFYLALYEPCPSLMTDPQGNVYLYRVVAVRPAAPPASLADVRSKVMEDWLSLKSYEAAGQAAQQLEKQAAAAGLPAALEADASLRATLAKANPPDATGSATTDYAKVQTPEPFGRMTIQKSQQRSPSMMPTSIPMIGMDEKFVRECFRLGEVATTAPATQKQHVAVVELKRSRRWVVVQWLETLPLRQDAYDEIRMDVAGMLWTASVSGFVRDYFSPELIRRRAQWKDLLQTGPQT